ncbi:MAG: glycosyltransferase [Actinobacteria bacterium]|nr:glycosyltransferase [Actinomycetota bacterium]
MENVLLAIPAYNEELLLESLLFDIERQFPDLKILVVNDGSTDDTAKIIAAHKTMSISHSVNRGKGASLKSAFRFGKKNGFDWVITMDGDGQHPVESIHDFLTAIRADKADLILGHRVARKGTMPIHRQISNGITSVVLSICAGNDRLHDSQCGFRAVRINSFDFSSCSENGFQFESEMILRMGKIGRRFYEIPIDTVYGQEKSSINLFSDTIKFIKLIFKSFFY